MLTAKRLNAIAKKFDAKGRRECSCPPKVTVIRPGDPNPDDGIWDGKEEPLPCVKCGGRIVHTVIKVVPRDHGRDV